jgi:cytochrome c peroxidase
MILCLAPGGAGAREPDRKEGEGPLAPLPAEAPAARDNAGTPEKIALGKQLFFDPRLSGDNDLSCASCHLPGKAFADGLPQARGRGGKPLGRNAPTLLNAAFHRSFFWDGRAGSLEEQALAPIQAADEMHQDLGELEKELNAVPGYVKQFASAFGTRATRGAVAQALAAFLRTLRTRPSPFDRYLQGEKGALSDEAKEGLRLFLGDAGCARCHRGPLLSDGEFYRLGVGSGDSGRGAITGNREDDYKFRTPSLRNVARTAPYMHDGSLATLTDVVTFYYRGAPRQAADGLPLDIQPLLGQSFSEIAPLVAFLESLTGEPPEVAPPDLP